MKENILCFYLKYLLNAYLLISGVFMLKYIPTRNKPSPKARSDAHPPGSGKNALPAGFTVQAKENTRFYAAEHTLFHNVHQATCPVICLYILKTYGMFMISTQYVNYRHQRHFKLGMQMILHKYNVYSYN